MIILENRVIKERKNSHYLGTKRWMRIEKQKGIKPGKHFSLSSQDE